MKKVIIGIFVFALLASTAAYAERGSRDGRDDDTATSTKSESRKKGKTYATSTDGVCVSTAVAKREDAILGAWNTLDDTVEDILKDRKAALVSAWALSDVKERKSAVKDAWTTSKKERKEAASEYKKAKKDAWAMYKKEARACGGGVGNEASGESEAGEKLEI
jgi:hypothetical protein